VPVGLPLNQPGAQHILSCRRQGRSKPPESRMESGFDGTSDNALRAVSARTFRAHEAGAEPPWGADPAIRAMISMRSASEG
jgi:hypothetical protein